MRTRLLPFLVVLAVTSAGQGAERHSLDAKVLRIIDGDTIEVIDSNQLEHKVRLAGIDAPEKDQAFGNRSRQNLARIVAGKIVHLEWSKTEHYGRWIAVVRVPATDGCDPPVCRDGLVDANLAQIVDGYAWHYKDYQQEQDARDRSIYAAAETSAKVSGTGLWRDADPVAPWDFRHGLAGGPVKKSRSDICHDPGMSTYGSVKVFESFPTLEECIASGGRLPKGAAR